MRKAYVFPKGVKPTAGNVRKATPVIIPGSDHASLHRAAEARLLRCIYRNCLREVQPVHQEAPGLEYHYFAHVPGERPYPLCPYRAHAKIKRHLSVVADLVEFHLRWRFGTGVSRPRRDLIHLRVSGLDLIVLDPARPATFVPTMPRSTMWVVDEADLAAVTPKLASVGLTAPIVVVRPDLSSRQRDHFGILEAVPPPRDWPGCTEELENLDVVARSYGALFRVGRRPMALFMPTEYSAALAYLDHHLTAAAGTPHAKLHALLAKRLLVDGARVHQLVFRQSADEARCAFLPGRVFPKEKDILSEREFGALVGSSLRRRLERGPRLVRLVSEALFAEGTLAMAVHAARVYPWLRISQQIGAVDREIKRNVEPPIAQEADELKRVHQVVDQIRRDLAAVTKRYVLP